MRLSIALALIALAAGCNAGHDAADTADAAPAADTPVPGDARATPEAPAVDGNPDVVTRYACDADTTVVVLRDGGARVSLPEGRDVDLSRIAGSQPPIYTGSSLYLTIGDDRAHLSQGDQTNELTCSPL